MTLYILFLYHSLSHGYQINNKKISAVSTYFETFPYRLNEETGYIDYESLEKNVILYRPKLIIAGASAYPRNYNYERMRKVLSHIRIFLILFFVI